MGEPISVIRRAYSSVDDYGNPTWTTSTVSVGNGLVGFGPTGEPVETDRDSIEERATLYFPAGVDIEDGDIFLIRGQRWVKDGHSQEWASMQNVSKGVVVPIRRTDG